MTGRGRIALAVWLGAFAIVGSGCSQPRLERLARDITRSVPRADGAVTTGRMTLTIDDINITGGAVLATIPSATLASTRFAVQPGRDRGAVLGGDASPVVVLTDERVVYARRKPQSKADKRPWVRLELNRLDDISKPRLEALIAQQNAGVLAVISPLFITDLLAGVLTGSVKQELVDAKGNRFLSFNVSVDKANRELELTDDERDDRTRLLRALAITGDIFKANATLRADGSLSRLVLRFTERPDRLSSVVVLAELITDDAGTSAPPLDPPTRESTIRVGSLAELRGNIIEQLAPAPAVIGSGSGSGQ